MIVIYGRQYLQCHGESIGKLCHQSTRPVCNEPSVIVDSKHNIRSNHFELLIRQWLPPIAELGGDGFVGCLVTWRRGAQPLDKGIGPLRMARTVETFSDGILAHQQSRQVGTVGDQDEQRAGRDEFAHHQSAQLGTLLGQLDLGEQTKRTTILTKVELCET